MNLRLIFYCKRPALNVYLNYGQFIQNVVDFLIIALCIFLFVKVINTMKNKLSKPKEEPAKESVKSDELKALEEIVELLKNKSNNLQSCG